MSERVGKIYRIAGPLVVATDIPNPMMYEVVYVGKEGLIGEVIAVRGEKIYIQVYEETTGLTVGEKVEATGRPLSAELGPGLIGSIYDGLQRPEKDIARLLNDIFIRRGVKLPSLDRSRKWYFVKERSVNVGDKVYPGDIIGYVNETPLVKHYIMIPPNVKGELKWIADDGDYAVEDTIAVVSSGQQEFNVKLYHIWPIRIPRPYVEKLNPVEPLVTGIRVIDHVFPIAKGGKAAVPGGFGTGKTVLLQELTKWSHADIAIYVGCGERGNEMSDALTSFLKLMDVRRGRPMMERSVFIANTSNMPVAARETSVFLGITIAEYFRDMGYDVIIVADSTSRWAEAMREISGRMEEMPGEEGFPAYLASRLSEFYERAGKVKALGKPERFGSVTIFGAVSPPGGDFSEPVVRNTVRYVQSFYALDYGLATRRHFPAINWLTSYSMYVDFVKEYWDKVTDGKWSKYRLTMLRILQREAELSDIVRLVGPEALPEEDKLVLEIARIIREGFLQQSALDPVDAYSPPEKGIVMMEAIMEFYKKALEAVSKGVSVSKIREFKSRYMLYQLKFYSIDDLKKLIPQFLETLNQEFGSLVKH
ncbi:V-type ATP synthase subunit A [Ignisphaera sp. 4213-co]|uniref:A-type ATP synthase subunit A n=1 Tax=Ignisphaera cupida TaxID=3050454 RepID=A0ABD4Z4U4_9CREN|nr:V-type ATP synthase subunit A [Ignisphaera sp. 4213-co]MDK6027992.1 V-type ATP synthase subunit A [Ignisphaera sp. 4213-co]